MNTENLLSLISKQAIGKDTLNDNRRYFRRFNLTETANNGSIVIDEKGAASRRLPQIKNVSKNSCLIFSQETRAAISAFYDYRYVRRRIRD
jgi:hypothetical protein